METHLRRALDGLGRDGAKPQRRMRTLQGRRRNLDVFQLAELAIEGDAFSAQQALNEGNPFLQTCATLCVRNALIAEFLTSIAQTNAKFEPTVRNKVDGRGVLSDAHGVVQRKEHEEGANANPCGPRSDGGSDWQKGRRITVVNEVVLGQPAIVVAHAFGVCDEIEVIAIKRFPRNTGEIGVAERPQHAKA